MRPAVRTGIMPGERSDVRQAVLREYARLAPRYDRRWSGYLKATVGETVRRLDLASGQRVLEVGCGTGALLNDIRRAFPGVELLGVDPCAEMLEQARRRLGSSAQLTEAWAEWLPFGEEFDLVVVCNSFHYFEQPDRALHEMFRVLKPQGRLVITDWCDDYLTCKICDWFLRRFKRAHFKTYGGEECLRLLRAAGFVPRQLERYRIDWLWGLMTATAQRPPVTEPAAAARRTEPAIAVRSASLAPAIAFR